MNEMSYKFLRGMWIGKFVVAMSLLLALAVEAHARTIISLEKAMYEGIVSLENLKATGGSSGSVIEGQLRNRTNKVVRIAVHLNRGLFLRNRGRGQNMISTEIYLSSGKYWVDRGSGFIMIKSRATANIVMTSYCVDFKKDNPSTFEEFNIADVPQKYRDTLSNIRAYRERNPNTDITVSAQTALWLIQGFGINDIREKFSVSGSEANLARSLAQ